MALLYSKYKVFRRHFREQEYNYDIFITKSLFVKKIYMQGIPKYTDINARALVDQAKGKFVSHNETDVSGST